METPAEARTTHRIEHETRYDYPGPVTLSVQEIRLTPRLRPHGQELEVEPAGQLRFFRDAFENPVHAYERIGETRSLRVVNRLRLTRARDNPFDFLLAPGAEKLPVDYPAGQRAALAPFARETTPGQPGSEEAARAILPPETETVEFLVALTRAIHDRFDYEARDEPGIRSPGELLAAGKGSCRDFAALLAALLRHAGFAARFVSGYLLETGDLEGADSLHAWTETYLPGAGWKGLDPTNGVFCDDSFVPCAVGVAGEDAAPVIGRYYADRPVASSLTTTLRIRTEGEAG